MEIHPFAPAEHHQLAPPGAPGCGPGGQAGQLSRRVKDAFSRGLTSRRIALLAVDPLTSQRLTAAWIDALASGRLSAPPQPWQLRALTAAGIAPAVSPPPAAGVVRLRFGPRHWVLMQVSPGSAPQDWRVLRRAAREFVRRQPERAVDAAQPKARIQFIRVPAPDLAWLPDVTLLYRLGGHAAIYCAADQIGEPLASALTITASQLICPAIPQQMPASPRLTIRIERLRGRALLRTQNPAVGLFTPDGWVAYARADQIAPELAAAAAHLLTEQTRYLLWLPGWGPTAQAARINSDPGHELRAGAKRFPDAERRSGTGDMR
jgi:hypothetical protein